MGRIFIFCLLFLFLGGVAASSEEYPNSAKLSELIKGIKSALETMDGEAYSKYFSPEILQQEKRSFLSFLREKEVESIKVFPSRAVVEGEQAEVKLKILFLRRVSVIIDVWNFYFRWQGKQWEIIARETSPERKILYRLKIPAERVELAKTVRIKHADLELNFENAVCFFDNLPQLETALLVIGPGEFQFSPGVANERHYLKLMFGQERLVDQLKYAYLRFSNSFFKNNISIEPSRENWQPPRSLLNKAYSLFARHYSRSFTVENSLMSEFISFIPQGDEVVFEFEGKKTGIMTYVFSPFAEEEINLFQWKGERIVNLYSPESEGQKRMFVSFGRMFDIDAYKLEIDYNPKDSYLSGKAQIKIIPLVDSLDSLKFKFHQDLEVLKVYDQQKNELIFNRDRLRKLFYVYLLRPQKRGQPFYLEVFYRGKIQPEELTSDVVKGPQYKDEIIFIPPKFETHLFSQSSYWYPAPPDDDYFQVELRAIFPPGFNCISNGDLVERGQIGMTERVEELEKIGHQYCTYKTRFPIKYISFIVGKFEERGQRQAKKIPVVYYQASDTGYYHREWLAEAEKMIDFYSQVFGSFPYEKLYLVQRLWPQKGGHSPASFVILNELPRFPGRSRLLKVHSPVDLSRWKGYFLAHEIAHQWWGQALSWDTYHDQWLSEGLAQFAALLYLEKKYGEKAYRQIIKNMSRGVREKAHIGPITMGSRLSFLDFEAYQTIVYNKSTLALLMLRDLVGEKAFFSRLRKFFNDYKYKAARTADFFRYFKDLEFFPLPEFRNKWFEDYHLPVVYIYYSVKDVLTSPKLHVELNQPQNWFPFPLRVKWEENGQEVVKVIPVNKRFIKMDFKLNNPPRKIKFNPWEEIPGKFYVKKVS